jgi:hypothetical protein
LLAVSRHVPGKPAGSTDFWNGGHEMAFEGGPRWPMVILVVMGIFAFAIVFFLTCSYAIRSG